MRKIAELLSQQQGVARIVGALCIPLLLPLASCAKPLAPAELLAARAAYQTASTGLAAKYVPDQLVEAKKALDRAEHEFREEPKEQKTRDLAYIAQRRAQIAEALGGVKEASGARESAQGEFERTATGELKRARSELANERQARVAAERRAKDALDNLQRLGNAKRESRGLVITLSGGVLFASGRASLLGGARSKLDEVAVALKGNDRSIVVEGHTDSRGRAGDNEELSQRRASTVREYLVGQGVPAERIRAVGLGSSRPVASNTNAEGRANNRRVEIVVEEPR
jgi:outer membrane protein OmpA-like peptidoglycan-associated protein